MPSFSFDIPTVPDLLAGKFGYALALPDWMAETKAMILDVQNRLVELEKYMQNPAAALRNLANQAIGEVAGDLGLDNMNNVGDVSKLANNVMQQTGLNSTQLNQKVSDIANSITKGGNG